jgi:4-nitrophenyl phosphatase/NagD protein
MNLERLRNIRCYLFDMDGTVFLGDHLLPGALDFLEYLKTIAVPYFFLTNNSSRSRADYVKKLNHLGIPATARQIFTSGEATGIYLNNLKPGARLFVVGTPSLEQELCDFGFHLVQTDPDFIVLGFDTTLTYAKLCILCDFVRAGVPYIATHPDINCPTENGFIPDIGAMMALIAASTGRDADVIIGKPNPPIIEAVMRKTGYSVQDLVMVGDRLYTDIALGQTGIATVLVLSGETKMEDLPPSPFKPDFVVDNLLALHHLLKEV